MEMVTVSSSLPPSTRKGEPEICFAVRRIRIPLDFESHRQYGTLDRLMQPHGVAVYVEAHHLCTQMRGVRELHPKTRTTSYRGVYVDSPQMRGEFFDVSGLRRGAS